jgi:hypothetical protein
MNTAAHSSSRATPAGDIALEEPVHSSSSATPSGDMAFEGAAELTSAQAISGMIRIATMFATLIIGLIAGPAVSL